MYWCLDIGNTQLKWAAYDASGHRIAVDTVPTWATLAATLPQLVQQYQLRQAIVSSVGVDVSALMPTLQDALEQVWCLSTQLPLPLTLAYGTPETLGNDRLAVAAAAVARFPREAVLAVDAGTCITYDFVTPEGEYLGGSICPGIAMRFRAMHEFTARLPLVERTTLDQYIGDSTLTSLQTGVLWGVVHELRGFRDQYEASFGPVRVLVTGGSTPHFETHLKNEIFAEPYLVLDGLYTVLKYQNQYKTTTK